MRACCYMRQARIILFLGLLLLPLSGKAENDILYWKGEELSIAHIWPIHSVDPDIHSKIEPYVTEGITSKIVGEAALTELENFRSCWSIVDDRLCLDSIGMFYATNGEEYIRFWRNADYLKGLFAPYWQDGHIVASWFTGTFHAVSWESRPRPIECSAGFYTVWDKEWIFEIRNGRLLSARYENHLYHEGELSLFHPGDIYDQIEASFPYDRFPELAGTRFWVVMTNAVLNKEGRMIDFKPVLRQPPAFLQDRPELEAALFDEIKKRLLRTDWTIYRIDGEFTPGRLFEATRSLHLTFPEKEDHTLPE